MKLNKPFIVGLVGLAVSAAVGQAQLSLNFSSSPGSSIQFNGSAQSFQFNPSTFSGFGGVYNGTQWFIGSEAGGSSAIGLFGSTSTNVFSYSTPVVNGSLQTATVLNGPTGTISIIDGSNVALTGTLDWEQIQTSGFLGGLNAALVVNLSNLSYTGTNPDLQALVASGAGQINLTFQFSPGETLTQLSTGQSPFTTSYSGSISPVTVPEPASTALLVVGLGVLILARVFRKTHAKSAEQV